jgi:hypothetical protein
VAGLQATSEVDSQRIIEIFGQIHWILEANRKCHFRNTTICIAQALSQDHFLERINGLSFVSIVRIISSPQRDILPSQSTSPDFARSV